MQIEAERNILILRQRADLYIFFESFRNVQILNDIFKFLLSPANVGC